MTISPTPIDKAVETYRSQPPHIPHIPLRQIAKQYDVPPSTLFDRITNNRKGHPHSSTHLQALTPKEETQIIHFIRSNVLIGNSPTPKMIFEIADDLRRERLKSERYRNYEIDPLGQNWVSRFRQRHPILKDIWRYEKKIYRVNMSSDEEKMDEWVGKIREMIEERGYDLEDVYNLDQSGFAIGSTEKTFVMATLDRCWKGDSKDKSDEDHQEKENDSCEKKEEEKEEEQGWITTVECISAKGKILQPLVIFKALEDFNFTPLRISYGEITDNWGWTSNEEGWVESFLIQDYLTEVFIPITTPSESTSRRLLIVDATGDIMDAKGISLCMRNNIDVLLVPFSLSEKQPLRVGVFGPLKDAMRKQVEGWIESVDKVNESDWALGMVDSWKESLTRENVIKGWLGSGFLPIDIVEKLKDSPALLSPAKRTLRTTKTTPSPHTTRVTRSARQSQDTTVQSQDPPSIPPAKTQRRTRDPIADILDENTQWLAENENTVPTPVKNELRTLLESTRVEVANNVRLEKEKEELKDELRSVRPKKENVEVIQRQMDNGIEKRKKRKHNQV